MKITIRAAGSMKFGPERALVDDYVKRARLLARGVGCLGVDEITIETKTLKTKTDITKALTHKPADGMLVILDERGKDLTSRDISNALARWRDDGMSEIVFAIGDADGFDKDFFPLDTVKWRLGHQTWPHKLARVMIAEQIYRALSILARTPYHRD